MGEPYPKDVGLEDAVVFLDQVFELLDQRDFNPRRNGVMISKQWYGELIITPAIKATKLSHSELWGG